MTICSVGLHLNTDTGDKQTLCFDLESQTYHQILQTSILQVDILPDTDFYTNHSLLYATKYSF